MTETILTDRYPVLRDEVALLLQEGKARAVAAVERETLRTYHAIGGAVSEYLLARPAAYGEQTVTRLAADVGLGKATLYQAVAFYRFRPKLYTRRKLVWSHYRAILRLRTDQERQAGERAASKHGWSVRELEGTDPVRGFRWIRSLRARGQACSTATAAALRGQFYTYRLVEAGETGLRLDLGFGIQVAWPLPEAENYHAGQFLKATREGPEAYRFAEAAGRTAAFYTYVAQVLNVIDGDTVWLDIDCGFRVWTRQKVRLRGIDTPELKTPEGVRARDFVVDALEGLPLVVVTTTRPDKYGRYLADLFYLSGGETADVVLDKGRFLNRQLVEVGLAERVRS